MEKLILYPKTKEQLSALKAVAKALKVDFEIEKSPYDPKFVKRFYKEGKSIKTEKLLK